MLERDVYIPIINYLCYKNTFLLNKIVQFQSIRFVPFVRFLGEQ